MVIAFMFLIYFLAIAVILAFMLAYESITNKIRSKK